MKASGAVKEDVGKVRAEMKKVYVSVLNLAQNGLSSPPLVWGCRSDNEAYHLQDGLHLELLDMRAHVWGVEQDLQKVVKTGEYLPSFAQRAMVSQADDTESIRI